MAKNDDHEYGSADKSTPYEANRPPGSARLRDKSRLGLIVVIAFIAAIVVFLVVAPHSPTSPTPEGSAGSGQVLTPTPAQNSN